MHDRHQSRTYRGSLAVGLAIGCLLAPTASPAQPSGPSAVDARRVQPFLSETTFLVVKVDADRVEMPDWEQATNRLSPEAMMAASRASTMIDAGVRQARQLLNGQPAYATLGIPVSPSRIPVFLFVKDLPDAQAKGLSSLLEQHFQWKSAMRDGYLVCSPGKGANLTQRMADFPPVARTELVDAFRAVEEFPLQVLLLPPEYVRRTIRELSPELPSQLGGGSSRVLTEGLQWAALGADPKRLQARLTIQSASNEAARDLAAHLPKMLQALYAATPEFQDQMPSEVLNAALDSCLPQVLEDQIQIDFDGLTKTAANLQLAATIARTMEEGNRRQANMNRFKRILLATHNYYDIYKAFPPADRHRDKEGKSQLSWRVHLLPFLEHSELYRQFHLDEPWDSEHNKRLVANMPDVFASRSAGLPPAEPLKPGYTTFLAPIAKGTVYASEKPARFQDIRDGTSATVILVEVKPERAVPWTAPQDLALDPKAPAAGLELGSDGRWLAGFADGSVSQLISEVPAETIWRLFQMDDGHPIDFQSIR